VSGKARQAYDQWDLPDHHACGMLSILGDREEHWTTPLLWH